MEADFCIEALEEAMARYGKPEIFNTDQGSQFTSPRFVDVLLDAGVRVSMDGKGRWMDNVFIERLWRSLKYECVYIHALKAGTELRAGLGKLDRLLQCPTDRTRPLAGRPPMRHMVKTALSLIRG